jgi:tartrate dehydrogenase/decarboxylase/D-malate dehydrogenase
MRAIEQVTNVGIMTPDIGGSATTLEVTEAVCRAVRGANTFIAEASRAEHEAPTL